MLHITLEKANQIITIIQVVSFFVATPLNSRTLLLSYDSLNGQINASHFPKLNGWLMPHSVIVAIKNSDPKETCRLRNRDFPSHVNKSNFCV